MLLTQFVVWQGVLSFWARLLQMDRVIPVLGVIAVHQFLDGGC